MVLRIEFRQKVQEMVLHNCCTEVVGQPRLELGTSGLKGRCSTN